VTVTAEVDVGGPCGGGTSSGHGKDGADPSRVVDRNERGVSVTEISPLPPTSGLQIKQLSRP
jgi:hypothetical protein